ncbi:Rpn family recombination-promoting nuclease/putative transposase [Candidatus Poribacteria bacterium]|nr:Rpn family recombination-promoting nuclease/putative transposase [Candidatus Poribacteria bacterium]
MPPEELIPLIREFPDRSIRWLLETPANVRGLLLAVAADLAEQINYTHLQRVDRTFILDSFRKREADMIFLASFSDDFTQPPREVIIYILIEHQSTVDPTMPFRVLYYVTQIWEMQRKEWEDQKIPLHQWLFRPILPVVFYTGSQPWETPLEMKSLVDLPASLERFVPQQEILFLNLKATAPEQLITENHPFGWVLRVIQKEEAMAEEFKEALRLAVEHLSQMPQDERANWEKLMRFLLALIYHRREQEEHAEFLNLVETTVSEKSRREEVGQMGKTIAQAFIEEGKELGAVTAKQEAVIKLLRGKFDQSSQTLIEKIASIRQVEQLDALFDRALSAQTLDEVGIG